MIWLTLRQQRAEYIGLALVIAAIAVFAIGTGIPMHGFEGGLGCLSANAPASCPGQGDFERAFSWLISIVGWFNLIPLLIGVFIGAPIVAREIERGTHRLAWTQTVTRARWITVKLVSVIALAAVFGVAVSALMTWWRQPFDIIGSPFTGAGFDVEGLMPGVYTLFALALGVAVGAAMRKTLPAMAVTLPVFLAVRLPIEFFLRPRYLPPVTMVLNQSTATPYGGWLLDSGLVDSTGNAVYTPQAAQVCGQILQSEGSKSADACLHAHGVFESIVYQPVDRFWTFQFIEAGIFAGLSVLLLGFTVYWVRRRLR